MTPGDWERVDELFQRAIELAPDERRAFIEREAAGDATLAAEVLSLLSFDQGTPGAGLEGAVRSLAARVVEETEIAGERVGIYRIIRKIGEGGMGTVYLALRDDGEFRKEVAVKIVRLGMETPQFVERFRRERQILANIDHPYVARLLDGGAAQLPGRQVSLPYLVMEFVNGVPIHDYCKDHALSIADRCRLFMKVCEAVAHAHRQLIVHRDLKPGNILVTDDATPKLLDFGIAQLIAQEEKQDPQASRRQLTIDYASPEQVRGENAGVGTDIYSLGAVFYELLTNVRPHRFRSYTAPEVEKVICSDALVPPSATVPMLRGDLDAIVAKAMRKDPAERYGSVDGLRRDIENYLDGLPVEAREGGVSYRAGKFVSRHRWAVAGATLAVLGLAASTAAALWQANVAVQSQRRAEAATREAVEAHATEQVQRQRAEQAAELARSRQLAAERAEAVAVTQHAEAERRFNQVRELANRLLFEYQNEVATLPGSTAVRKKMVETGLAYFDTLARDTNLDKGVRLEMVDGWRRLGDIQGNPYVSNLGDIKQALASYERAMKLAERLGDAGKKQRAQLLVARGDIISVIGDFDAADAAYLQAMKVVESMPRSESGGQAVVLQHRADLLERRGQLTAALELYQRVLTSIAREQQPVIFHKAGALLVRLGRPVDALDYFQKGLAITDEQLAKNSTNPLQLRTRVFLLIGFSDLYRIHGAALKGQPGDALTYIERAIEMQDRLRAVEPFNQQAIRDWTVLEQRATSVALARNRTPDAERHGKRSVEAAEALGRSAPGQSQPEVLLGLSLVRYAKVLVELKRFAEADATYARATETLDSARKKNAADNLVLRERYYLARDLFVLEYTKAETPGSNVSYQSGFAPLRDAIRMNAELLLREPNSAVHRTDQSELHANLALLYWKTGSPAEACAALQDARRYRKMDPRPIRKSEKEVVDELVAAMPNCK